MRKIPLIIVSVAAVAAVVLAPPVAFSTAPPSWLRSVNPVAVRIPNVDRPSSSTVTVQQWNSAGHSVSFSWFSSTDCFLPGSCNTVQTVYPSQVQSMAIRIVFSTPSWYAFRPFVYAASGVTVSYAVIVNATTVGSVSSCTVGGTALGGRIIACGTVTGSGTSGTSYIPSWLPWFNVSATSIAVHFSTSIYGGGVRLDASHRIWVGVNGYSITASTSRPVYEIVARFPTYHATVTPPPTSIWQNYAYWNYTASPATSTFTISFANPYMFNYTLSPGGAVSVAHCYADGSCASTQISTASVVYDNVSPLYVNVSTTASWIKIVAPQLGEQLRVALPANPTWVSFYVEDYGQNYTQIRIYTQDGRLVWREWISSATKSAVARLTPYATYLLSLWRLGEERALGPLVVDKSSFTVSVLPLVRQHPPPPLAAAVYNTSLPGYVVDVYCRQSPCQVRLFKQALVSGGVREETASFTCAVEYCRFTWVTDDPYIEVVVTDAGGLSFRYAAGDPGLVQPAPSWERRLITFFLGGLAEELDVDPAVLLIVFAAVGLFMTLSVVGYVDVACFATAGVIVFLQLRYGLNVYAGSVVSAILILGGLYALTKRAR